MISKFSKKFYLYKRFFKYLKILKKIKNQLFFKQKKFTELFFYRLDVCLFEIKLFGSLKTVRQLINLNYIYLNMKIENKLNYFLKILDVITVCKKAN
jgi:ribosomal protein S4